MRVAGLPSALGPSCCRGPSRRSPAPGVTLDVTDRDLAEPDYAAAAADGLDIVVAHGSPRQRRAGRLGGAAPHRSSPANRFDVALPVGHPLVGRTVLCAADVTGFPWIAVPRGYPFATVLASIESVTGSTLERVLELRDNRLVETLVGQGIGLALLPRFSTPASADYALVPLADVPAVRNIVAIARPDRAKRLVVRAVLDALRRAGAALV